MLVDILLAAVLRLHSRVSDVEVLQVVHLHEKLFDPSGHAGNFCLVSTQAGARSRNSILEPLPLLRERVRIANALPGKPAPCPAHPQVNSERRVIPVQVLPEAIADLRSESGRPVNDSVLCCLARWAVRNAPRLEVCLPFLDRLAFAKEGIELGNSLRECLPRHGPNKRAKLGEVLAHRLALVASTPACWHGEIANLDLLQHSAEKSIRLLRIGGDIHVLRCHSHDVCEYKLRVGCVAETSISGCRVIVKHRVLNRGNINSLGHGA